MTYTLPPHAAEVMALFGFPNGADASDTMWWRTESDGSITLYAMCNDLFYWATADCEKIEEGDVELLRQTLEDLRQIDEEWALHELFAARKRKMRPQRPCYKHFGPKLTALFDACGPERDRKDEG